MPLTKIQKGAIGQSEAAKFLMMGSDGELEVANPVSDDDRRDAEIHIRGQFGRALALQDKTTMRLVRQGATYRISFTFNIRTERIVTHPLFWYLFAYLDPKTMAFGDPIFLVPSAAVHASLKRRRGKTYLAFHASMSPTWLLATAIAAAMIPAPDPDRPGPPFWSIAAILLLPVMLIGGCEAGSAVLPG